MDFITLKKIDFWMDYKTKFKTELAEIYNHGELSLLFKLLVTNIKKQEFNHVLLNEITLNPAEENFFNDAVQQLKALKPFQYVLGEADFYGLKFRVNKDVLIPRPETEELVDLIVQEQKHKTVGILDIGTGSGCIPITLKYNLPNANVSALDISLAALAIAQQNAERHQTSVNFIQDDALNLSPSKYPRYDAIVSNPPYIALREKINMERLVLDHEPHLALFVADNEALIFYDKISDFAKTNLKPGGTLYFEINQNFAQETKQLIERKGFNVLLIKDLNNNFRMMKAQLRGWKA